MTAYPLIDGNDLSVDVVADPAGPRLDVTVSESVGYSYKSARTLVALTPDLAAALAADLIAAVAAATGGGVAGLLRRVGELAPAAYERFHATS